MFFEDFEIGRKIVTPTRMMTEKDLDAFLELSGLDNPIFQSRAGAAEAGHEKRLVPAPFQLSAAMGLCQKAGLFDRVVAVLEFEKLKFIRTVHPGDVLKVEAEALEKRETSRSDRGLVRLGYRVYNQDDQEVMTSRAVYLMRRRKTGNENGG